MRVTQTNLGPDPFYAGPDFVLRRIRAPEDCDTKLNLQWTTFGATLISTSVLCVDDKYISNAPWPDGACLPTDELAVGGSRSVDVRVSVSPN